MASFVDTAVLIGASIVQTFGIRVGAEQPAYVVLEHVGSVEIRQYQPRIVAETTVGGEVIAARNEGFRRIAGYIFGGNQKRLDISMTSPVAQHANQQIAMTAPVAQERFDGSWKVQFFMPAKFSMADLPTPNDPSVKLVNLPAQTYAVTRFTGPRDAEAVKRRTTALLAELDGADRPTLGAPVAWFYDPPWTLPFVRRNEVAVQIAPGVVPEGASASSRGPQMFNR